MNARSVSGLPWSVLLLAHCACTAPKPPGPTARAASAKLVLVVADGLGLAEAGPGNAVTQAMAERPDGFLARALIRHAYPMTRLDAAGACVGLAPGRDGNSEAGHSNLCGGEIIEQHHTTIARLRASGELLQAPGLVQLMDRVKTAGRPLHVVVPLADRSSGGHYADLIDIARLAMMRGVPGLVFHGLCNGRSKQSCLAMAIEIEAATARHGRFGSVAGVDACFSRSGVTPEVRQCVAAMMSTPSGDGRTLGEILQPIAADPDRQSELAPEPVRGGKPLTDIDEVLVLTYRRDISGGLVRVLRQREDDATPPAPGGPRVTTITPLDRRDRYDDDPRLDLALPAPVHGGLLHARLAASRLRELRVAEQEKAAHVTYFCDGDDVRDGPAYERFHPSAVEGDITATPCLRSKEAATRAIAALAGDQADFVLINLPNADLLGHAGGIAAAVAGIECVDGLLDDLRRAAEEYRAWLVVTADHGNAEAMLKEGRPVQGHSANPVPLIIVQPPGAPSLRLVDDNPPRCLSAVTWTVLDLLGLPTDAGRSLRLR